MSGFKILRATIADKPRIATFLRGAYYKHEPLNVALGLRDKPSEADVNHTLKWVSENKSLLAIASDSKIVGVAINGEVTENEAKKTQKLIETCDCKDFARLLKFSLYVERNSGFWNYAGEKKAFSIEVFAVDSRNRGQSVGIGLTARMKELAKETGYKVIRVVCTSCYAAKLAELNGMTCVFEINYNDYKDDDGEVVFKVAAPHKALRLYMLKL